MDIALTQSPENFHASEYYALWVKNIRSNLYDRSDKAYPYTPDSPLYFTITSPDTSLKTVYVNDALYSTNTATSFIINVKPLLNKTTQIYAKDAKGRVTNKIIFNVYNSHFLIFALTTKYQDLLDEIRQSDADRLLTVANSAGVLKNNLTPSDKGLFRMFGDALGVLRVNDTYATYVEKLTKVLDGFHYCATVGGFKRVLDAYSSGAFDFITYNDLEELRTTTSAYVRRKPGSNVIAEWFPTWLRLNRARFFLDAGELTLATGAETFIYVDGEVSGSTEYLVVKTALTEPLGLEQTISEVPNTVYTDIDGTITGFVGGRYVITNQPIISVISITSTGSIKPVGASVIDGYASVLNLHTTEDDVAIGTITLQYRARVRPIILAKVTTDGSEITKIEDPVPSRGALYRTRAKEESDFELYLDDDSFTAAEENQLLDVLAELNTSFGTGHVYVKDTAVVLTDYEYHKNNYRYVGAI